jgi:hypothetical protein
MMDLIWSNMLKHCPWFPSLRWPGVMSSVAPFFSCHDPWGLHLFGGLDGFLSLGHRWLGSFNSGGSGVGLASETTSYFSHNWKVSLNHGRTCKHVLLGLLRFPQDTCDLVPEIVPKIHGTRGPACHGTSSELNKKKAALGSNFWIDDPLFWAILKHILLSFQRVKNHLGRFDGFHDHPWPVGFKQVASSRISPTSEQISSTPEVAWWNDHCSGMSYEPIGMPGWWDMGWRYMTIQYSTPAGSCGKGVIFDHYCHYWVTAQGSPSPALHLRVSTLSYRHNL